MKLLVPIFVVLALAACGSSSVSTSTSTGGSGTTGGTSTGGKSGSSTGGSTTGTAAGTTTGAPDTLGTACALDASTGADPCGSVGLECSDQTGAAGTCILPQNISLCAQDGGNYGCQDGGSTLWVDGGIDTDAGVTVDAGVEVDAGTNSDAGTIEVWVDAGPFEVAATVWVDAGAFNYGDLVCAGTFQNGVSNNLDLCLQPCTETFPDCPIVFTNCLLTSTPKGCFFNICHTQNPFDTCDATATGANDGQCYQYFDRTTQMVTQTVCYQNGTAQNGQPCDPNSRVGTDSECGYSSFCMPNAANDGGVCFPISPSDGGACATATDVIVEGAASIFGDANLGICVQDCSTGQTCIVGTCQAQTTGSACLP